MAITNSSSITTGAIQRLQPIFMRSNHRALTLCRALVNLQTGYQSGLYVRDGCACFKTTGVLTSLTSKNGRQCVAASSICSYAIPLSSTVMSRTKTWMNFIALLKLLPGRQGLRLTGSRAAACLMITTNLKTSTGSATSCGVPKPWW